MAQTYGCDASGPNEQSCQFRYSEGQPSRCMNAYAPTGCHPPCGLCTALSWLAVSAEYTLVLFTQAGIS
jgi:hypothetical protein